MRFDTRWLMSAFGTRNAAAVIALLTAFGAASAASLELSADPAKTCSAIELSGNLEIDDYEGFSRAFKAATATAPVRRLYLNSGGGNLLAAIAIAELLRNSPPIETIVQANHYCASACVILLAAGSRRLASPDSTLILHQAFDTRTGKRDASKTSEIGRYLIALGMPVEVLHTLEHLKPDEELTITHANAKSLGFASIIFFGGSNPPATPQCSWAGFIVD